MVASAHGISQLAHRFENVQAALDLGEGRVAPEVLDSGRQILERSLSRRQLSAEHTVIGFFGATGSGKSSLFNAVIGQDLAPTAVRRPTTSSVQAAVWGRAGSEELLDWLEVEQRIYCDYEKQEAETALNSAEVPVQRGIWGRVKSMMGRAETELRSGGLILLDLPDFDSVAVANRATVEKMVGFVDVLVWVFDPQKYADAVIHRDFIAPLADHGAVTMVVLNQSDRLDPYEIPAVLDSLQALLARDGLSAAMLSLPMAVSAHTGDGIDHLRGALSRVAVEKLAALQRIEADLDTVVDRLKDYDGNGIPDGITGTGIRILERDLYQAVGASSIVDAAGESYQLRAVRSTGWLPTRWLLRFRKDPLKRLNLHREDRGAEITRSSLPPLGAGQLSAISASLRRFAADCSEGVSQPWSSSLREAARSEEAALPEALERALASTDFRAQKKLWWWKTINVLQWASLVTVLVGLLWLTLLALADYFQITLPPPQPLPTTSLSLPTLLVAIGLLVGGSAAIFARLFAAVGKRLYRKKIESKIKENIGFVADHSVVTPVQAELERHRAYCEALGDAH